VHAKNLLINAVLAMAGLLVYDRLLAEHRSTSAGQRYRARIPVRCSEAAHKDVNQMLGSVGETFQVLNFDRTLRFPGREELNEEWHRNARIDHEGVRIQPFWAHHGRYSNALGFIFNDQILYLSNSLFIYEGSLAFIQKLTKERRLEVAVLDMLAPLLLEHHSHQSLMEFTTQAVALNAKVTFATQTSSTAVTHHELHDFFTSLRGKEAPEEHAAAFEAFKTNFMKKVEQPKDRTDVSGDMLTLALLMAWLPFYHFDEDCRTSDGKLLARAQKLEAMLKMVSPEIFGKDVRQAFDGERHRLNDSGLKSLPSLAVHQGVQLYRPPSAATMTLKSFFVEEEPVHLNATLLGSASSRTFSLDVLRYSKTPRRHASLLVAASKKTPFGEDIGRQSVLIDPGVALISMMYDGHLSALHGLETVIVSRADPDA
jgi:hypothetical protein